MPWSACPDPSQRSVRPTFCHSKTNQLGSRVHKTVALAMPGRLLDPYDAVAKAFALCPRASATDPAFAVPRGKGGQDPPLTHSLLVETLRRCLYEIGIDHSRYSGHNFRRGGATFAFRLGEDPLLIKRMGDWMSDAYTGYIEHHTPEGLVRLPRSLAAACAVCG